MINTETFFKTHTEELLNHYPLATQQDFYHAMQTSSGIIICNYSKELFKFSTWAQAYSFLLDLAIDDAISVLI